MLTIQSRMLTVLPGTVVIVPRMIAIRATMVSFLPGMVTVVGRTETIGPVIRDVTDRAALRSIVFSSITHIHFPRFMAVCVPPHSPRSCVLPKQTAHLAHRKFSVDRRREWGIPELYTYFVRSGWFDGGVAGEAGALSLRPLEPPIAFRA